MGDQPASGQPSRIRLSDLEKSWHSQIYERVGSEVPFWVVEAAGGERAGGAAADREPLRQVVDRFGKQVLFVEAGAGDDARGSLQGVLDLVGQTTPRQLVRLLYHAQGVLCRTAGFRQLAAAVEPNPATRSPRACFQANNGRALAAVTAWFNQQRHARLTPVQKRAVKAALRKHAGKSAPPPGTAPGMFERAFAVACDAAYFPGLRALLNSIAVYHGRDIPVFLYHRGLTEKHFQELRAHRVEVHLFALRELPFPAAGMWEAKQQLLAHCIGRARCVYLLDADLVLVSSLHDVFELASAGNIVSSQDGRPLRFGASYAAYHPRLPGSSQAYLNSGALCLDVVQHWDLAGLWAFTAQYGAYTRGGGPPLGLPGHGDQGVLNALAGLLRKSPCFHPLPEGPWCDSTQGCRLQIQSRFKDGQIEVWNATAGAPQRLVHSSGPKWWTPAGATYLRQFGDKLKCFRHFAALKSQAPLHAKAVAPGRKARMRLLVGICSCIPAAARRAGVRATWLKRRPREVLPVFFTAGGPLLREEDVIRLPVQDGYPSLPQKVQAFFRYALSHYDFDCLFKCDDDTYVCLDRLLALSRSGPDYMGSTAWVNLGYASGGAGYLLSRRSVELLASAPSPGCGPEDVWVGTVLRQGGVPLQTNPRLQPDHQQWPSLANDLITAHWCSPERMAAIDQEFSAPAAAKSRNSIQRK